MRCSGNLTTPPVVAMAHEAFISYSSKDGAIAERVCAALESAGIGCWMAPRNILPGTEWLQAIMEAIHASHVLVLIVSSHAVNSPQVQRELVCAVNQRVPILPLRVEAVTFSPAFEYLLCVPQWLDAVTPPLQQHLPRLVEAVRQLLPAISAPAESPRPTAAPERRPHNLPVPATPLVGREQELKELQAWLTQPDVHLVTLTGTGGTGKTRLSLELASGLLDHFSDGVYIVFLELDSRPRSGRLEIAQTLEVREEGGRRLLDSLKERLRDREMLLVLDNFEQVMTAAPRVAELLAACPRLKLLISSREALQVRGEREFHVPPLALPPAAGGSGPRGVEKDVPAPSTLPRQPTDLARYAAVSLFVQRAAAVKPGFALSSENGPAIAENLLRLDGLPLAIELAAARIKLLPPAALLSRLENRLKLLSVGARDLPERQRTLRGAIDWSYDLLEEGEKTLFQRLAVFAGGFALRPPSGL